MTASTLWSCFAYGETRKARCLRALCLFCFGLLTSLPFTFPALEPLSFLLSIPTLVLLFDRVKHRAGYRRIFAEGVLCYFGYHVGGYYWFNAMFPLDFVGLSPLGSLLFLLAAVIVLPLFLSLFYGLLHLAFAAVCRALPERGYSLLLPPLYAAGFVFLSFLQTHAALAEPFVSLALTVADLPILAAPAALFGNWGLEFSLLTVNGYLAVFLLGLPGRKDAAVPRKKAWRPAVIAVAIAAAHTLTGTVLFLRPTNGGGIVRAAVIQGNTPSTENAVLSTPATFARYAELTRLAKDEGATLALWPEGVMPILYPASDHYKKLRSLAEELGMTLAVGSLWQSDRGTENVILQFYPDGRVSEQRYSKQHLVPFGEYIPGEALVRAVFPFMTNVAQYNSLLVPGEGATVITDGDFAAGAMICFDSAYPGTARDAAWNGAEVLYLPTNDSWFKDTSGAAMHLAHAKLRAIETGRYVMQSAHTGISAVISDKGIAIGTGTVIDGDDTIAIPGEVPPMTRGYLIADVMLCQNMTLYGIVGDVLPLVCLLFLLAFPARAGILALRRKRQATKKD